MSLSREAPSSGRTREACSGKESPLFVPEFPPSLNARGNMASADTIVSEQESPVAYPVENGHESPSFSMNRWPRGRLRNAVSRVGYISDDAGDESTPTAQKGPPGVPSPVEQGAPVIADLPSISLSKAGSNQSLKAKHARPQSRPRAQHMHLAVPTALGRVRPRVKPTESPGEAPAPTTAVKPRPAALTSMASRQESFDRALTIRSRAPSQQDVSGHVSADFQGGDLHPQTSEGGSPRRAALTVGQRRSRLGASEQTELPFHQPRDTDSHERGTFEAGGTQGASASHRADVAPESNAEDRKGLKQQPTQDRDLHVEEQRAGSRASPPSRAEQVRRSFAQAFAAESERRAAALASRSSSRPISRVEGQIDQKQLAQRANVAAAAAEQLKRMTPPQEDDLSDSAGIKDQRQEADAGTRAEPVEPQADHPGSSLPLGSSGSRPLISTQSDRISAKAVEDLPEHMPSPTPPTAAPRDASSTPAAATEGAATQRRPPPQSLQEAQKEIKVMLEVEEQRRAAVSASRARSRIVSRAEGSVDPASLASRSDVAKAAAEQLRRLAEQTKASGKHQTAAPTNGYQTERHRAATKIQAVWRGHRIRLWVNAARLVARFTKLALPGTKMSPSKLRQPRVLRPRCNVRTAGC